MGSFFDDAYHLYTYTTEFFGPLDVDGDGTTASTADVGPNSPTKPPTAIDAHRSHTRGHCDNQRRIVTHILRTWERTALHQYADYEVRAQLVQDLRHLFRHLDRLFFAGRLDLKASETMIGIRPCERVRLDIFESMPSPWHGGVRRYLGARRHAFSSGGHGSSKRCHGLSRGRDGGRGGGIGISCCSGGSDDGSYCDEKGGHYYANYEGHAGATVWTSLLARSAKSLRRRRRLRIGLVLRSPEDGNHYGIEHLLRVLVHEMCHAYIEKMWEADWPAADYEAFVRRGPGGGRHNRCGDDHHGVLWQALCWKAFEEIESWGIDSVQGLRRQDPMLADLARNRTGVACMPEASKALFRSLGPGLV
ncbi:hypothetical protein PG999_011682 [Apiospora kogelbergensis]|uniref:SprT-like domain-containing protein n=1 Tax=Apiospora kogelbergensis TaxID=1337665 RepID=A0AAW0QTD5_9PEZI